MLGRVGIRAFSGPFNYLGRDGKSRSRYSIYILSFIFLKINVVIYFISQDVE